MRVDKKKNVSNIAKEYLKNPLQTEREVWQTLWINRSTVNRAKEELHEIAPKDERIVWICDDDLIITKLTQKKIIWKLQDEEEKLTMLELVKAWEVSSKRYSLFIWDATDEKWWSKLPDVYFQIVKPDDWE